jgi:putative thiamine transport system substrate-binding protein
MLRRTFLSLTAFTALAFSLPANAENPDPKNWDAVLASAKGETVYWNAWGGAENINAYIDWAGKEPKLSLKKPQVALKAVRLI